MINQFIRIGFMVCFLVNLHAQCDYYSDFSDPSTWTQVGNGVRIENGRLAFQNGANGGEQRRVYQAIGHTLSSDQCWTTTFLFRPTMLGELYGHPMTGHILLAYSETTRDPRFACPDIPCTGNPPNDQDAICVGYYTPNPPNGDLYFIIQCSNTGISLMSERLYYDEINRDIYIQLTKAGDLMTLNIFADEMLTQPLGSGAVELVFPNHKPLQYAQHATGAAGWEERQLWGYVDDVCLSIADGQPFTRLTSETICVGDSFLFRNDYYFATGILRDTISNSCRDTILTVDLTVLDWLVSEFEYFGCSNDGYAININNTIYNEANPAGQEIMTSSDNCDSVVNISLQFYPEIVRDITYSGCLDDGYSIIVNNVTYNEANPAGQEIIPSSSNCDSVINISLEFNTEIVQDLTYSGCLNDGYSIVVNNVTYDAANPSGQEIMISSSNCDSIINISLSFTPADTITQEIIIEQDANRQINVANYMTIAQESVIAWSPAAAVTCDTCRSTSYIGMSGGTIQATILDAMGCQQYLILNITLSSASDTFDIYLPSIFSPNNDGINDTFYPLTHPSNSTTIQRFQLFNRWGSQVFDVSNLSFSDERLRWDGRADSKELPEGVYVYELVLSSLDGNLDRRTGSVTLVR